MSLELISPIANNYRRDLELADPTLLDPNESDCLVAGEWMVANSSRLMARVGASPVLGALQLWTQKGDMGAQAIGKAAFIVHNDYEADTDIHDGGAFAINSELTVHQITVDTVTRCGLTPAASGEVVYAYVTKLPADNNGKVRFRKISPYQKN